MFRGSVIFTVLWISLEVVSPFSWDIVVGGEKTLEFYDNGQLTHKEEIQDANMIHSVVYDAVHDKVLFCDHIDPNVSISSYDLTTNKIQYLFTVQSDGFNISTIDFDSVRQLLFLRKAYSIMSFSLNSSDSETTRDAKVVVGLEHYCDDIAVDSYGGYLYWMTIYEIERIRFDGTGREAIIRDLVLIRLSLTIDLGTQQMYWLEGKEVMSPKTLEVANLRGENRTTFYVLPSFSFPSSLAITEDFIYCQDFQEVGTWQLPKNKFLVPRKLDVSSSKCVTCQRIAAKYTILEQN